MYVREKTMLPDRIEIHEKHTGRYGAPGERRGKKSKATSEQVARQNRWKKISHIRHLLLMNFQQYDYFTTLTYRTGERPETLEEAKKDFQAFMKKVRAYYKSQGVPCKWLVVGERGSRGGIHFHLVLNRVRDGDRIIAEYWKHGGRSTELMRQPETFGKLAEYLAKLPKSKQDEKSYFSHARGLLEPKVIREVMKRKTFQEKPFVPKGYYLDKGSVREGESCVNGHPYRLYTVMRC